MSIRDIEESLKEHFEMEIKEVHTLNKKLKII